MNENIKNFIKLIKENPDLPVVPIVDGDIVGDDGFMRWLASFGIAEVGEYACYGDNFYQNRDSFEDDYYSYNEYELIEKFSYDPKIDEDSVKRGRYTQEQLDENNKHETEMNKYLDEIADKYFKKAIFVYINTMD